MSAMDTFLADYENGKNKGRYIEGELPTLPFENGKFDLTLSSHFLFLYSMHLSAEFHLQALREMLRVAREVRIFPLLTLDGTPSSHLGFVTESLSSQGYHIEIKPVLTKSVTGISKMQISHKKLMGVMQRLQKTMFVFHGKGCISRLRRYVLSSLNRRFKWGRNR